MYWFYTFKWRNRPRDEWEITMNVHEGTFDELILFMLEQKEEWKLIFAKEISKDNYDKLLGEVG